MQMISGFAGDTLEILEQADIIRIYAAKGKVLLSLIHICISFLAASAYAKPSEEDREHMNEEGHAALAEAVYAKLKEMLAGEKENAQIPA